MQQIVIYTRYSTDMQRSESCEDQEREVRAALTRMGIDPSQALVLRDEAESGIRTDRAGFEQLQRMIQRAEVALLAVDDQSRLSRADNACAFITDLVYSGGRFLSTGEGIDTQQPGWELRVKVMELHHGQVSRELQHRVRRGQIGRVLEDGSAGDFPFGYESYYLDPQWAEQLARRGPKPKKGLRICEAEARWVRQVFDWFLQGKSIGWISRELTQQNVPKGHRASTPGWHHEQVRRMLTNTKYIGQWVWGATTTRRNSQGKKKQVIQPDTQRMIRDRPELRIIEQAIWNKAQSRLAELAVKFGRKQEQKNPASPTAPTDVYPRTLLGGLLVCGLCGQRMWQYRSGQCRYLGCPGYRKGLCGMATRIPARRAEQSLVDVLTDLLRSWPEWMQEVYQMVCALIQQAATEIPRQVEEDLRRQTELKRQISNLVNALAEGTLSSSAIRGKLAELESEAEQLETRIKACRHIEAEAIPLPDEQWLAEQVRSWFHFASGDCQQLALVLRQALGQVTAHPVVAPGKQRGYAQLRFRLRAWDVLGTVLGDHLPAGLRSVLTSAAAEQGQSPEVTLDLGQATLMDQWAPRIAVWRAEGVHWHEIVRRTGLDLNRAHVAWKRYTQAQGANPPAD